MSQNSTTELVCETFDAYKITRFMHEDEGYFSFSPVIVQIGLVTLLKTIFQFLLMPFGQQRFVSEILGGIAISPSFVGHIGRINKYLFAPRSVLILDTFEVLGLIFVLFLLSMRMDIDVVRKCGKLSVVIGFASFVVPTVITTVMASYLSGFFKLDQDLHKEVYVMAVLISTSSFQVVFSILEDLKLLNSELGRLALSSSMISGLFSWSFSVFLANVNEATSFGSKKSIMLAQISRIPLVVVIVFTFRPMMSWMVRQTPEGQPLKQSYILIISTMVLLSGFFGEINGHHYLFGPLILGLATPNSPQLNSSLMEKIGTFVDSFLVPCFLVGVGSRRINLFLATFKLLAFVQALIFISTLTKLAAIIVTSLYYKMPFRDALSLGIILNCKGFVDTLLYNAANKFEGLKTEFFSILVVTAMLQSVFVTLLVRLLYDPSRRYIAYTPRTIRNTGLHSELQIIACLHQQDDVPPIINVLEATNPTRASPITIYVLNLKRLIEGTLPLFISHKLSSSSSSEKIDSVGNAFCRFEQENQDLVTVQCFTSFAPYATMHDDVCTLALEKGASLVIVPFQPSDSPSLRAANTNILGKAPYRLTMKACVVFIGGANDRETLAYAQRMSRHPNIQLTVLRLVSEDQTITDLIEKRRNLSMINEFSLKMVEQGNDTVRLLGAMCNDFDLIMVGRRHDPDSSQLMGLSEWGEIDQDLGVIGDIMASKDCECKASILVVQQQASVVVEMIQSQKYISVTNSDR
ncbi:cation/H(+) antiporter [Salix suchowensis]|nr:cation/H(+) antiporter [Salix suchowensis]